MHSIAKGAMHMVGNLLAASIEAAMERERMDVHALAELVGEPFEVLNWWLGHPKQMPLESVVDIARAFGMQPSALF